MKKFLLAMTVLAAAVGCTDFLEENPSGVVGGDQAENDPEKLLIAAYAMLGNDRPDTPYSLWAYGNVRADDAYKGGSGESDNVEFHFLETATNISTDLGLIDQMWYQSYCAISRVNAALRSLRARPDDFPLKQQRIAEGRFLRGHFYFILKILFKYVPYIDETVPMKDYGLYGNLDPDREDYGNDALWARIAEDFEYGIRNLPAEQEERGRPDRYAAAAYAAKTYLYKAYRQDFRHNVTGIDQDDLQKVLDYTALVLASHYRLELNYASNFLPGDHENGVESIFAVQYSQDDGTKHGRINYSDLLNVPSGVGCCDFHKPSQTLVNAFRTENGLPVFGDYNTANDGYAPKNDPRLFHTVALPGLPYKYNTNRIYEQSWSRNPVTYGYYASMKENVDPDCKCFIPMIPFYGNSMNRHILRMADVLLFRAEALIERTDGSLSEARTLINQVRNRAAASGPGYAASRTQIAPYEEEGWSRDYAREALRRERRMELAMEGCRFFDLVRWGIADRVMNDYYDAERSRRTYYAGSAFIKNKHEYLPIPEAQIRWSKDLYKQNEGYH